MGANYVRADGRAGAINPEGLADGSLRALHFICEHDLVYELVATEETTTTESHVSGVQLEVFTALRGEDIADLLILAPTTAYKGLRNWLMERRHFKPGELVHVTRRPIDRGDRLEINGHRSSRVVRGFVKEADQNRWLPNF